GDEAAPGRDPIPPLLELAPRVVAAPAAAVVEAQGGERRRQLVGLERPVGMVADREGDLASHGQVLRVDALAPVSGVAARRAGPNLRHTVLLDPGLAEENPELGVVLVVAEPFRDEVDDSPVPERNERRLIENRVFDLWPENA